jgi:Co/Zn/Cd efflux system component
MSEVEDKAQKKNKLRLMIMFGLTTFFFFVEIVVGYLTNSVALIADSFHMLSDLAALLVAFFSVKVIINR